MPPLLILQLGVEPGDGALMICCKPCNLASFLQLFLHMPIPPSLMKSNQAHMLQ